MSYEPGRSKAYGIDIRWRIVYQLRVLDYSVDRVSANLGISVSTVRRIGKLFDTTGSVDAKTGLTRSQSQKILTSYDEFLIMELVLEKPGIYLHEISRDLQQTTGTHISEATICRFLQKAGFTHIKLQHVAFQQNEELRARYAAEIQLCQADMFVFVDERGADHRDCMRKFGYSLKGKRTRSQKLLTRGRHVSAIAAMSTSGVLDFHLAYTVDANEFRDFVEVCLLRHLMPFDGNNSNSIVILDNASVHHAGDSVELIESIGALVIFLPPYSPDLNAIEEMFSTVKSYLKASEGVLQVTDDIEGAITEAFATITPEQCQAWVRDAGYA